MLEGFWKVLKGFTTSIVSWNDTWKVLKGFATSIVSLNDTWKVQKVSCIFLVIKKLGHCGANVF